MRWKRPGSTLPETGGEDPASIDWNSVRPPAELGPLLALLRDILVHPPPLSRDDYY